jgi:hypothetical protein
MTMQRITYYSKETGVAHSRWSGPEHLVELNAPEGHAWIEGHFDMCSQRVDVKTGQLVDWQPPQPSPDHEWNAETRRWQLSQAIQERRARRQVALARIMALEASQARPLRELARDPTNAEARKRIDAIEEQIVALRGSLG